MRRLATGEQRSTPPPALPGSDRRLRSGPVRLGLLDGQRPAPQPSHAGKDVVRRRQSPSIDLARRLELVEVRRIGPDIRLVAVPVDRARLRLPLFASGDPTLAERVEEGLVGFGEGSSA
jgi:hypothetical protein